MRGVQGLGARMILSNRVLPGFVDLKYEDLAR
jgi:hypothetical protein